MKLVWLAIISGMLGGLAGGAISWAHFGGTVSFGTSPIVAPAANRLQGGQPKALVDQKFHDFGPVERDTTVAHTFRITNVGKGVLVLKAGGTTCTKCTIAELSKTEVAPGETADVRVEYQANASQPRIRQTATVLTNDPDHERIELDIFGTVTTRYRLVPEDLVLSQISANETHTSELKFYSFVAPATRLVKHELLEADMASFYEVTSSEIPADKAQEADAKSGCLVSVTIKPGLPLGAIRQTIRLTFEMQDVAEPAVITVPISGRVDSDISIVGKGWNQDLTRLTFGAVKSAKGAARNLTLLVRGEHRRDVTVKVGRVDPSWLKVTVGAPAEPGQGAALRFPLKIEIPPGMPPVNHLGSDQGNYAEVVLETSHPQVKELTLYLQFVIEK